MSSLPPRREAVHERWEAFWRTVDEVLEHCDRIRREGRAKPALLTTALPHLHRWARGQLRQADLAPVIATARSEAKRVAGRDSASARIARAVEAISKAAEHLLGNDLAQCDKCLAVARDLLVDGGRRQPSRPPRRRA